MKTIPVWTPLELRLQIDGTSLTVASVATCDPSVWNGIKFVKMLSEDGRLGKLIGKLFSKPET